MAKVAWIGLGVMGYPMAGHILKKGGHDLVVYNRNGAKAQKWVAEHGKGRAAATPEEIRDEVARGRLDGGTVLLHDSDCASEPGCWRPSVAAIPLLAELVRSHRLTVGPLGEHGLD